MNKFKAGKIYTTRSICDHECIFSYTVVRRSEKSVWISNGRRTTRRSILVDDDGVEFVFPEGKYSMCPVINATKVAV